VTNLAELVTIDAQEIFVNKLILVLVLPFLFSCGKKAEVKLFHASEANYQKFVNPTTAPLGNNPDISGHKNIINEQYPVQVSLYADHTFYYDLPNLGDGHGTWEYVDGKIVMSTKREIFGKNINMTYELQANDENAENVSIQFTDRWGAQSFRMRKNNL
jgi:hypothetical protein